MKVYDILVESDKKVDEGPIRFLKRTLGKNTAAGRAAQLDVEIDKEVKNLYKDFYAMTQQDPQNKGMTVGKLANFLKQKGFVSDEKAVVTYLKANPTLTKRISKAAGGMLDKVKGVVAPKGSGLAPGSDPKQGELDLKQSVYAEALEAYTQALEAEAISGNSELGKKEVKIIMKKFVQQGFQKQVGSRLGKSSYADAPGAKKSGNPELDKIKAAADKLGYTLTAKKK
jgi:hypothetical protein